MFSQVSVTHFRSIFLGKSFVSIAARMALYVCVFVFVFVELWECISLSTFFKCYPKRFSHIQFSHSVRVPSRGSFCSDFPDLAYAFGHVETATELNFPQQRPFMRFSQTVSLNIEMEKLSRKSFRISGFNRRAAAATAFNC